MIGHDADSSEDERLKRTWEECEDPAEALYHLISNWGFIGSDPYYRDLNDDLFKMAERLAVRREEK